MPMYPFQAQKCSSRETMNSLRAFVQSFYDWYVPLVGSTTSRKATIIALRDRPTALDLDLALALKQDEKAQEKQDKIDGSIVGLDFDPFLSSQDPCEKYVVGNISKKGNRYFAEIYSVCSGEKGPKPDLVAELAFKDASWVFVNFHYPDLRCDLLGILERLRKQRHESPK
jgi:hypothetical protein